MREYDQPDILVVITGVAGVEIFTTATEALRSAETYA